MTARARRERSRYTRKQKKEKNEISISRSEGLPCQEFPNWHSKQRRRNVSSTTNGPVGNSSCLSQPGESESDALIHTATEQARRGEARWMTTKSDRWWRRSWTDWFPASSSKNMARYCHRRTSSRRSST